jgi:hypothetical protein
MPRAIGGRVWGIPRMKDAPRVSTGQDPLLRDNRIFIICASLLRRHRLRQQPSNPYTATMVLSPVTAEARASRSTAAAAAFGAAAQGALGARSTIEGPPPGVPVS